MDFKKYSLPAWNQTKIDICIPKSFNIDDTFLSETYWNFLKPVNKTNSEDMNVPGLDKEIFDLEWF